MAWAPHVSVESYVRFGDRDSDGTFDRRVYRPALGIVRASCLHGRPRLVGSWAGVDHHQPRVCFVRILLFALAHETRLALCRVLRVALGCHRRDKRHRPYGMERPSTRIYSRRADCADSSRARVLSRVAAPEVHVLKGSPGMIRTITSLDRKSV